MAIIRDEVMICDQRSNVKVYTKELAYSRVIGSHGTSVEQFDNIMDLTSDLQGNLYIADGGKSCIHVLNNAGTFLHSISGSMLYRPRRLCMVGQYVYVINQRGGSYSGHSASIFTSKGDYVASFGNSHFYAICGQGQFCVC